MVRHLWGLASAAGLLVLVFFGLFGLLSIFNGPSESGPSALTFALLALGGGTVMIVGIAARGEGQATLAKVRRMIAAVGLIMTPIALVLTFLALATDPTLAAGFFLVTLLATAAWAQGIAAQLGLSVRVSFAWLLLMTGVVLAVVLLGGVLATALVGRFGWDTTAGTRLAFAAAVILIATIGTIWARGRPDRQAVSKAVGRAALGRAEPGDLELLEAGPRPILGRRR